jgi:uncharacterized protein (DUF488 family)
MLYTVGHSNHSFEHFLHLLKTHQIEVLADVRSVPASRFTPQFNGTLLKNALLSRGLKYVWLESLGGRPNQTAHIDADGHADYALMAQAPSFLSGLERLKHGMKQYRVAIMCSEENPNECHRRLLVVRALCQQDSSLLGQIQHIRSDGYLQLEADLQKAETRALQDNWFAQEVQLWRSPKPIPLGLPEKVLVSSSGF